MSAEASRAVKLTDQVKIASALFLLAAAIGSFIYFSEESLLYRVLATFAAVGVVIGIFLTTEKGKVTASFLQAARVELRKVIWPTRPETLQTTIVVFVMVVIVAIFLWALDMFLAWLMSLVIR